MTVSLLYSTEEKQQLHIFAKICFYLNTCLLTWPTCPQITPCSHLIPQPLQQDVNYLFNSDQVTIVFLLLFLWAFKTLRLTCPPPEKLICIYISGQWTILLASTFMVFFSLPHHPNADPNKSKVLHEKCYTLVDDGWVKLLFVTIKTSAMCKVHVKCEPLFGQ